MLDLPYRGLRASDRRVEETTIFILSPARPDSNREVFVMTQQHIQVSHRDVELDAELRQSQADRFEKIERARNPQPDPPAKKAPAKEAAVKSATSKPFPPVVPKPAPKPPPAPPPSPPPQVSALPPGARILTAEEMAAVDHLLQTHPETRQFFLKETR